MSLHISSIAISERDIQAILLHFVAVILVTAAAETTNEVGEKELIIVVPVFASVGNCSQNDLLSVMFVFWLFILIL